MTIFSEEELSTALSSVLLNGDNDVDGLDEDLVAYIAGLVSSQADEGNSIEDIVGKSMVPFLESVGCPSDLVESAKSVILAQATPRGATQVTSQSVQKLKQGLVNLSSALTEQEDEEANRYLWGTANNIRANANTQIDAYHDKTSAKDRRKQRQELERARRDLDREQIIDQAATKSGVSAMLLPTAHSKEKDVQVRNVTVSLNNGTTLLEQGDLKFTYQRRYGLIGENGVGKTTLLNRIANWEDLDGFPRHLRVLHVKQELNTEDEETSVIQAVLEADIERQTLLREEKELLARLENHKDGDSDTATIQVMQQEIEANADEAKFGSDMKKLKEVYERLQLVSSDTAEVRASMILGGLQFSPDMQTAPLKSLSGGWRMRVALGAALLIEPDILMLDEPTNHLDLEAIVWLERYLKEYKHTVIIVSHDRGFLNEVCTDTIEFKNKKLTYYRGNFDTYIKLRDEHTKNAMRVYQAYQTKRAHMMEFIEKFRANAKRATMVQSRIKTVEKMDAEAPPPVETDTLWRFSIPSSEPLGRPIISVDDVSFDYSLFKEDGTKKTESEFLLQRVNFGIDLSSKIAILGANGQGKTTLLNLVMGKLRPVKGSVTINGGLRIGHFTQHHSDNFDLSLSATENMLNMFEGSEDQQMRSFLGKFQIQGNDALKPMRFLSGGQKSRVAFAALAYKKPHVLVIDEGSNHLSMDAIDALVAAVQDFQGGIMVVSHDQYFVSNTCTELWVVDHGIAARFRGNFEEYKAHTAEKNKLRVEESVQKLIGKMNS